MIYTVARYGVNPGRETHGYYEASVPSSALQAALRLHWPVLEFPGEWEWNYKTNTYARPGAQDRIVVVERPDTNGSVYTSDQKLARVCNIGGHEKLVVQIRFDDHCGNGYNSFAITAEHKINGHVDACGCIHDMIAKHFPELRPYLKWHLCSVQGPLHYLANTIFLAGDRDCWGDKAGRQQINKAGEPLWQFNGPGKTLCGGEKPTDTGTWTPVTGVGKERELALARNCAIWPDATEDDLTAPGLENRLKLRLHGLIREFRTAIESIGLEW